MMKIIPTLSSTKKREVIARKLSVLEVIEQEKGILFAQFSSSISHADKVRGWQAVLHRAKAVGLVGHNREWRFIRDKVFSVWKSRTMTKRENAIATGPGASVKFDKVDLKILDIIGQDSPIQDKNVVDDVPEIEDQAQERIIQGFSHFADDKSSSAGIINTANSQNKRVKRKFKTHTTDDYLTQKKRLTLDLLSHDIYLRKLQALKLEKELGLVRSEYTQELEPKGIKTEDTCEMEFQY